MELAKVIALYNKIATYDPNDYRPISLLSHFDQILEDILYKMLISFLERNQILYCHKHGFRKYNSVATEFIKYLLGGNHYVKGILIDLKKGFDTVDHEILLNELDYYGIRGHANESFRSYLTNRCQYIVVNYVNSSEI